MAASTIEPPRSVRRPLVAVWGILLAFLLLLWLIPVRTGLLRSLILLWAALAWAGALLLFRRRRVVVACCVAVALLVGAVAILPGREPDPVALRAAYLNSLRGYQGTLYVWGGETHLGIDCSGLVRCALADAEFHQGLTTLNPHLLRHSFVLWWRDASARTLMAGYSDNARVLFPASSLNAIPSRRLQPGDFAVARSGIHTLAYLGENTWIAADGDRHKVLVFHVPAPEEHWFNTAMVVLRWRALEVPRVGTGT